MKAYVLVNRRQATPHYVSIIEWGNGCWNTSPDLRSAKLLSPEEAQSACDWVNEYGETPEEYRFELQAVTISLIEE